jgi:hypothetical protein
MADAAPISFHERGLVNVRVDVQACFGNAPTPTIWACSSWPYPSFPSGTDVRMAHVTLHASWAAAAKAGIADLNPNSYAKYKA